MDNATKEYLEGLIDRVFPVAVAILGLVPTLGDIDDLANNWRIEWALGLYAFFVFSYVIRVGFGISVGLLPPKLRAATLEIITPRAAAIYLFMLFGAATFLVSWWTLGQLM